MEKLKWLINIKNNQGHPGPRVYLTSSRCRAFSLLKRASVALNCSFYILATQLVIYKMLCLFWYFITSKRLNRVNWGRGATWTFSFFCSAQPFVSSRHHFATKLASNKKKEWHFKSRIIINHCINEHKLMAKRQHYLTRKSHILSKHNTISSFWSHE